MKASSAGVKTELSGNLPNVITDVVSGQRISLLNWKTTNIRSSFALAFFVVILLGLVGYLVALALEPAAALTFVTLAVGIAVAQNMFAYWYSDHLALRVSGARKATVEEHRYLVNITEAVAIGAGVPAPQIYVIDSPAPNAFATGRNPEKGAIAVTTGLLQLLDRQELEGVIAHEMAHIRNYDVLFGSMLAATVGALVLLRDLFGRSLRYRGGRSRRGGKDGGQAVVLILLLVVMIVAPLLATMLKLAVSRRREFLADASGAYITRNPEGLARALEKLRDYRGERLQVSEGVRHLYFMNPVKELNASGLFATHPPLAERIDRLRRM